MKKILASIAVIVFLLIPLVMWVWGVRLDRTASLPYYLYIKANDDVVNVGDFILFCPDDNALTIPKETDTYFRSLGCDDYSAPFIKIVGARGVGTVVFENGQYLNNGVPVGPELPDDYLSFGKNITLTETELFVVGTHPYSNDSRVFGPISESSVLSIMKPIL